MYEWLLMYGPQLIATAMVIFGAVAIILVAARHRRWQWLLFLPFLGAAWFAVVLATSMACWDLLGD